MTVLEVIQRSTEFLVKKGVDSPRLQAELLLADMLKRPRMQLYLDFERTLSVAETEAYRQRVKRRGQREPVQQIVGSTSFCGLEIAVNRHVLVPRPETELLAEEGWKFLNERAGLGYLAAPAGIIEQESKNRSNCLVGPGVDGASLEPARERFRGPTVLDFGTGSGCLAVTVAVKCPEAIVHALDLSPEAIEVARQNAAHHAVGERITFFEGDGFSALPAGSRFDLILSNPPYIPSAEIDTLQPEVRDYEPRQALDGGLDGLDFYRQLATEAGPFLKPGAATMVEFGDGQGESLRKLFEKQKWIVERLVQDYTQRQRILIARWTAY